MAEKRLIDANALPVYKVKIVHSFGIVEGSVVFPDDIKKAPTIDAVPVVHGRWESCWEDWRHQLEGNKCSVCGFEYFGNLFKYCPNCGAKMDAKEVETDG